MRRLAAIFLLSLLVLTGMACGTRSKSTTGTAQPKSSSIPAVFVRAAAEKNSSLFAIFPRHLGTVPCQIPGGSIKLLLIRGTCSTQARVTSDSGGRTVVFFEERWGGKHFHVWQITLGTNARRVVGVRSTWNNPPQFGA